MPGPTPHPVKSDPDAPQHADVVVIGGGIIGASTALELAERGLKVALCEKGEIGAEQSSRNWGWVRLSWRDPREIPLMLEAIRAWETMDSRTGRQTGYRQTGILFTAPDEAAFMQNEAWSRHLEPFQVEFQLLRGAELDAAMPGHRMSVTGALLTPCDGRAEPQWAAPAIAEAARDAGAAVLTRCAVRGIVREAGHVSGVVTEQGSIKCSRVVLAGGAWSRLFAGNEGVELPQLKVMNSVLRTTPVANGPDAAVWADRFALRRRADGGYTVASGSGNLVDIVPDSFRLARMFWPALRNDWRKLGFRLSGRWREEASLPRRWSKDETTAFERHRILDPCPSKRTVEQAWAATRAAFPIFETAEIAQSWAGLIDVTPDAIPVISEVEDLPGFFIVTGFSGHGFGIAPGAGKLMADLVTAVQPCVDPTPFRLSRFSDGSPITLMPAF
ncbi:FAD-binding oxidoreductase [Thalassococcus sp. S3]|uniref:NAD(P)/FAD-dependent oxidoreductase n=1 Tax=Thalassococcus sp. S3 TaxID=2017482 RepID=UPI0010244BA2|nr:FAD-binding oxidoreductase [Thalassococcus sp. S3]QBF30268.1 D-amino-acid oxidase [Thalassococcus sp. S3]